MERTDWVALILAIAVAVAIVLIAIAILVSVISNHRGWTITVGLTRAKASSDEIPELTGLDQPGTTASGSTLPPVQQHPGGNT